LGVHRLLKLVKEFKIIFWDFDGVIKDSVRVKSKGYEKLFLPFGEELVKQVSQHHEAHGGISRYDKIPLYLGWAGEPADTGQVKEFCDRFSILVKQAVIDSPWVPGVLGYLRSYHKHQCFIMITGTPQEEIEQILKALKISDYFREVHGAPKEKAVVVNDVLKRLKFSPEQALVIGDSETDLEAAKENNVSFLLRRTPANFKLQGNFTGPSFKNLSI
jgi:phosphoglycolate phosphatase-like HAD superfamily hydrolase